MALKYGIKMAHCNNGPAVVWYNGTKEWYLNGIQYTQEEFILLQFSSGITIDE